MAVLVILSRLFLSVFAANIVVMYLFIPKDWRLKTPIAK